MLEQLFGSTTRVKLLRLFLCQTEGEYYIREIARRLKSSLNAVRRELSNLEKLGFLISETREKRKKSVKGKASPSGEKRKYYKINPTYVFYQELKSLILKDRIILKKNLAESIKKMRGIKLMVLTGFFTEIEDSQTDLLIVGRVNRNKLRKLLLRFRRAFNHPLHYTVMTEDEYQYRLDLTDRFLYNILENKQIRVVDKLKG